MSFDLNSGSGEINTIENCAELAITHHTMAYRNYPSPAEKEYAKKNFPQVAFCLPINNPRAVKRSSMVVKVNGQQVQTIYGEYSKLLAIFQVVHQLQMGIRCQFCKRRFPSGCSVASYVNIITVSK
ncbi:MAG: hypothetical protein AAB688_00425 [Patescibacteria group bacterium]